MEKEEYARGQSSPDLPAMTYRMFPSIRLFMVFLAFCGLTAINCGFAAFNFAIVCMVGSPDQNGTNSTGGHAGVFAWDKAEQANFLAAYAWGSVITSIPSGWLCDKYGGRYVFLVALLVATISTAISPWAAFRGESWLFAARVFAGMAGGSGWPSVVQMATRWGRPTERPFLIALGTVGPPFGQLMTSPIAGVLCQTEAGWPSIFYMWAGFQALMAIVWICIYTDEPEQCRFISEEECEYLTQVDDFDSTEEEKPKTPWRHLLFSPAACAIYFCHFCNLWVTIFANEFVPTYGKEVLKLDMASNGYYSALPLLTQVVACVLFGGMAQKLTCKSRSVTFSVKFFNTLCMGIPCFGLVGLTVLDRNTGVGVAIFCLCLCTFFLGTSTASFIRCLALIAPRFSGTISSVSNLYSNAACIIVPYVVGAVTADGSVFGWHVAFYIALVISLFGWLEFMIFGSGEEQKWAKQNDEEANDFKKADSVVCLKF